jgi:hypothetical protein
MSTLIRKPILLLLTLLWAFAAGAALAQESGKVTLVSGLVEALPPGGSWGPVAKGDVLVVGTEVRTAPGARAVIVAGPGAAIRVSPSSQVALTKLALEQAIAGATNANSMLIDVREGTVSALIDRAKQPGADFQVRTPQGVAAARGTIYAVTVRNNTSYAKVQRGRVAIYNQTP